MVEQLQLGVDKKVAVFGAGTMGSGIALISAKSGNETTVVDNNFEALEQSRNIIAASLTTMGENDLLDGGSAAEILSRISFSTDAENIAIQSDLIFECIIENADAKKELYEKLDSWCGDGVIIASNTSYLNIFDLMPERRQRNTLITHWFAPAHIIPLVEVVRGDDTSAETLDAVVEWLRTADKVPVILNKFVDGFCVNRLQRILGREIFFLLDNDYISPEMLDVAVKASIVPRSMVLGFVQRYDFTGLDLSYQNLQNTNYLEPPIENKPKSLKHLVDEGNLGVKTGRGFFDYSSEEVVDTLRRRDVRLIEVFQKIKHLIYQKV